MTDPRIEVLEKVAEAIEPHRDDIVLCGGMAAFLICRMAQIEAAMTDDIDLTVERQSHRQKSLTKTHIQTIAEGLKKVGFEQEINSFPIGKSKHTEKWVLSSNSHYIEFLTEDNRQQIHDISGIKAQGLSYFTMSLDHTFIYKLSSGREIRVVTGSAFTMHKILTFVKRKSEGKKFKDLYYVIVVGRAVFNSPEILATELKNLSITDSWHKTAKKNLALIVKNLETWSARIKDNDPLGTLTEDNINEFYTRLTSAYS